MTGHDDGLLNALASEGDRAAFQSLVLRHEARLRAFLGRLAGHAVGDELAQEAFLKAWQRAREFRGDGSYASWITGIGWRLFLDYRRTEARRAELLALEPPTAHAAESGADAMMDVVRLLDMMKPVDRAAIILCDGHGWSHAEAADILGVPLGSLKSGISRAKLRVQTMLNEGRAG